MPNGHHFGGWRHPQAQVTRHLDFDAYVDIARKAEAARLDMIFIADRLAVDDIYGADFATPCATVRPPPPSRSP